ncbi:hypothetical protein D1007_26050 [Hordeum vulgare]|nr:hypothetical protein D1007_26050 [Hordeum vulgare]
MITRVMAINLMVEEGLQLWVISVKITGVARTILEEAVLQPWDTTEEVVGIRGTGITLISGTISEATRTGMPKGDMVEEETSGIALFNPRKGILLKVLEGITFGNEHKNSEDREVAQANKAARKKEKLMCYRCGVSGHFVVDCTNILCDICLKPGHTDATCPLLLVPKPIMNIYGVCHTKLMFFDTPGSSSVLTPPRLESSRTSMVKVTNGELTAEQVSQQMKRLVSETYSWDPIRVDGNSYQVEFPRREDLLRLLTFGLSKVSGSKCLLEFEECIKPAPQICNEQDNIQNTAATPKVDSILSIPTDLKEKHMMSAMRADSLQEQEFSKEATSLPSPTNVRDSNSKQQVYSFIADNPIFDSPLD